MSQSVNEKQQYVNKLNRIAPELSKISPGAGARSLDTKVDSDNKRYENVKQDVNKRGEKLFDLLQRTSTVSQLDSASLPHNLPSWFPVSHISILVQIMVLQIVLMEI